MAQKSEKNQNWMVFALGVIVTALIGVGAHLFAFSQGAIKRDIASVPTNSLVSSHTVDSNSAFSKMSKQDVLKAQAQIHLHARAKVLGHISSKVEKLESSNEDKLVLKGIVKTTKDIPELKVKWILGETADVLEGEVEHSLSGVKAGKVYEFVIELEEQELNQRVFFHAFEEINGENYGYIDQFNSRPNAGSLNKVHAQSVNDFKIDMSKQRVQF